MPHQLSNLLTVENETDRRYGIERYSKETRGRDLSEGRAAATLSAPGRSPFGR